MTNHTANSHSESNSLQANRDTCANLDAITTSVTIEMSSKQDTITKESSPNSKDEIKNDKKPSRREKPKEEVTFRTHLTSLAHISVIVFVYLILKLSFRGEFVFFTWHPILMSVGWMLLMTEGLYAINKYNTYWRFRTKGGLRIRVHWIALSIGYAMSVIGFLIVYINKNINNKEHFVSWHGLFGLIAIVSTIPPIFNGIVLLYSKELSRFIKSPKLLKFGHVTTGCASFLFGSLALFLSTYTKWYERKSEESTYIFWLGLISATYPLFWAIYGPSVKLIRVISEFIKEKEN